VNFFTYFFAALLLISLEGNNTKETIAIYEQKIHDARQNEKGLLMGQLSILYLRDQEHEKAFKTFLESLTYTKPKSHATDEDDSRYYLEALELYLDHRKSPYEISQSILEKFERYPEYHLLGFIVAAAYANQGKFEKFFDRFYTSYTHYPDHYLSYKARAVLYIKLFERARTQQDRDVQRTKILENVSKAIERYPKDDSLYKLVMVYAPEDDKYQIVATYLNKIINQNIIVPRKDIAFYVQQAVAAKQIHAGYRFIDKAKEWYQYSRTINAAEEFLKQHE